MSLGDSGWSRDCTSLSLLMTLTCLNTRPTLPWERCGSSYLLPHTDVSLSDQNSRVVDGLSKSELEHLPSNIVIKSEAITI